MMKAIKITRENKNRIEEQYNLDEGYLDLSSGLYLVAAFGHQMYEGLLTKKGLDELFDIGNDLKNDYFEVTLKPGQIFLEAEV